jgi:ABC-type multidrug transport system ATPase subunit
MTQEQPAAVVNNDGYCIMQHVTTQKGKQILQPMELHFPANAVTAILGPSGSGKTTLLSVLTDSIPSNVTAAAKVHMPGDSAFVPQEDQLHGFYTCRSYMQHYARLSGLHAQYSRDEMGQRIDTLLKQLGLTEQAGTVVGDLFYKGLSGGQKRRLSIALVSLFAYSYTVLLMTNNGATYAILPRFNSPFLTRDGFCIAGSPNASRELLS